MKKSKTAAATSLQAFLLLAGGVNSIALSAAGVKLLPNFGTRIYSAVVLVMLAIIVAIEIGSVFKIHDSTVHTVFTSCSFLLCFLFCRDMLDFYGATDSPEFVSAAESIEFVSFHLVILSNGYLVNYLFKTGISGKQGTAAAACCAADCALYFALKQINLEWVAYIAVLPLIFYFVFRIYRDAVKGKKYDLTFFLVTTIMAAAFGVMAMNFLSCAGVAPVYVYGVETTYNFIICMLFAGIYVAFMLRTERNALKASEYKLEAESLKTKLLREQINPHFIFNSLTAVRDAYHTDIERGDRAMGLFSDYLRANVNAMNLDLIPFGEELDNVENYVELINLKSKKPVNIIYDVESEDFRVPVLSLQVFVENAVRYARIDEKEGGYIAVSSYRCDGGNMVKITDNGAGFNADAVKETSAGIRNARERFKLLLGTNVDIDSAAGRGTTVKIFIPDGNGEIDETDNS